MDDNAQNPSHVVSGQHAPQPPAHNASQSIQAGSAPVQSPSEQNQQPVSHPVQPPPAHTPPVVPVGGMNKEAGPIVVEQPLHEVLQPSEKAPEIPLEVAEAGVEHSKNPEAAPDLTLHDQKAGLSHAPAITPVPTQPTGIVDIAVNKDQALAEVKANTNPKNSKSWLVLELLKMAQRKLLGGHE